MFGLGEKLELEKDGEFDPPATLTLLKMVLEPMVVVKVEPPVVSTEIIAEVVMAVDEAGEPLGTLPGLRVSVTVWSVSKPSDEATASTDSTLATSMA